MDLSKDSRTPSTPPDARPSFWASARDGRWKMLLLVAGLVLFFDQFTKFQAVKHLTTVFEQQGASTLGEELSVYFSEKELRRHATPPKTVFHSWWSHVYAENPGAAWSFAANWPENIRLPFFHLVSLLAIVFILVFFNSLGTSQRLLKLALALVLGGALGNLTDRVVRGYVIDFIDWHLNDPFWMNPKAHWPTFNVADVAITVGVALIALDSLLSWIQERRRAGVKAQALRD